ncbi:MAG: hypothetical protein EP297_00560 [Gammaproteobacteria bacterium]|nr:MAG: hypothetical protein EP297_00560 [Gammaproteobacteria bacterium]
MRIRLDNQYYLVAICFWPDMLPSIRHFLFPECFWLPKVAIQAGFEGQFHWAARNDPGQSFGWSDMSGHDGRVR